MSRASPKAARHNSAEGTLMLRAFQFFQACPVEAAVGLSTGEVEEAIQEAQDALSDAAYSNENRVLLLQRLQSLEVKLIAWRTRLAQRELHEARYVPAETEIAWIKRVARFYHVYVPHLSQHLKQKYSQEEDHPSRPRCRVFVSHQGGDKLGYAAPLAGLLRQQGVQPVFVDMDMAVGGHPDEQILLAACTCQTFWCVLTREFVQHTWPMRELMIAYTRHVQERENHAGAASSSFCLLMDCLETTTDRPDGSWLDALMELKSLQLYCPNGIHQAFPANMQQARTLEPFHLRHSRLAQQVHLVQPSFSQHQHAALVHNRIPSECLNQRMATAKNIRILHTWIPNLGDFCDSLLRSVTVPDKPAMLRFLLLDPDSALTDARSRALSKANRPFIPQMDARQGILHNLEIIRFLMDRANCSYTPPCDDGTSPDCIQLRFYNSLPSVSIWQTDETAYIGLYFHGQLAIHMPHVQVEMDSLFGSHLANEFETLWECAVPVDPRTYRTRNNSDNKDCCTVL